MPSLSELWNAGQSHVGPMAWRVARWRRLARRIIAESQSLCSLSDKDLKRKSLELRWRARAAVPLKTLLPEAYALVRVAALRALRQEHFEVQIMGGIGLFHGGLVEMQTGEGKTLTATLAAYLRALPGYGCHVITFNDYLAARDCRLMQPVYQLLGLTVGCVVAESEPDARRQAYACDITYATSREVGFDFLRDRMKFGVSLDAPRRPRSLTGASDPSSEPVQRGHHFALVDEADSVLIDDASTPMILSVNREMSEATREVLYWSRELSSQLREDEDFQFDRSKRVIELTNKGVEHVIRARKPPQLRSFTSEDLYVHVEQALQARHAFQRNRDYVIAKDEITIVDERTGRPQEGRKWQAGLHQAIEAKELVPLTDETAHGAAITVQTFFRRYEHLAGMTGTAVSARAEFRRTYRLAVTVIPTNRPCLRAACPTRIFATQEAKRQAMVPEIERLVRGGRSVLIGTPSVHASEALGQALNERGLACQILNARFLEQEADIVAQAGETGRITIATNMAGRGTDIHLSPAVQANGGLHVIATELHTNRRVDRQLIGRAARQGDPGSYQFWLSLEDELLRFLPVETVESLQSAAARTGLAELPSGWLRCFQKAQRQAETLELKGRKGLLDRDLGRDKSCRAMGLDPYLETPE